MKRVILLTCLLGGCGGPAQRPYQLTFTPPGSDDPLEAVATAMTGNGFTPSSVDRAGHRLATRWEDTGQAAGELKGAATTLVRRYVVTVARAGATMQGTVRVELQRCVKGQFSLGRHEVDGTCEEAAVTPAMQEELDRMGASLGQALAPRP